MLNDFSKKIGLDIDYFAKNGLFLLTGHFVSITTGLLLSYSYASFLTKEFFGEYSLFIALTQIIGLFGLPAMGQVIIKAVSENKKSIIIPAIKKTIKHSFIGSFSSILLALIFIYTGKYSLVASLLFFAIILPFSSFSSYHLDVSSGEKNFRRQTIFSSIQTLLFCATSLIIIYLFPNIFLLTIIPLFVTTIFFLWPTWKITRNISLTNNDVGDVAFGVKLSYSQALLVLAEKVDQVFIGILLGPINLATYYFIQFLPNQINNALKILWSLAQPKIYQQPMKTLKNELGKKMLQVSVLILGTVVAYITIAPVIFKFLYSTYNYVVPWSQIYSLTLLALPVNLISITMVKVGNISTINRLNLFYSLTLIITTLIFVTLWGIPGAIIAKLFFRLIMVIINLSIFSYIGSHD